MKCRITRISVVQTAKVFAAISFLASLPLLVLTAVPVIAVPGPSPAFFGSYLILMPLFYAVSSFFAVAIAALVYNLVARFVGGIEYTCVEVGGEDRSGRG